MKTKMSLREAEQIARRLKAELERSCLRIEIAGSVRRRKPEVGDIELVCIPLRMADLFGLPGGLSALDVTLVRLLDAERGLLLPAGKDGQKYKQFHWGERPELQIDLFITTPEEWGVRFTLSTGPAEFNKRLVTTRQQGGLLPSCYRIKDNRVWFKETVIPTPEERDVFNLIGGWVPPEERL